MNLLDVDLEKSKCPRGTKIEIEGLGEFIVDLSDINLLVGIYHVYSIFTGQITAPTDNSFLKRVTLIRLDVENKLVKVHVAAP